MNGALDPDALRRERRWRRAMMLTTLVPLPIARAAPVLTAPVRPGDLRPVAWGRNPCPRCGTRGDLGCRHFRPAEAAKTEEYRGAGQPYHRREGGGANL